MNGIIGSEIFSIILAVIALILSSSVVFILCWEHKVLLIGRPFIHFILNIASCDAITALTYAWGFPKTGSFTCKAQGFLSIFFSRASWLWTDILISQLYYFVLYKELYLNMPSMHAIVWTISLILQFIPMIYVDYGTWDDTDDVTNNQLCFYNSRRNDVQAVNISRYAYFLILSISLAYIFIVCILISCRAIRSSRSGTLIGRDDLWKKMIWYPLGLFVAWVPNVVYNWYTAFYLAGDLQLPKNYYVIDNVLTGCNSLYGIILSIFFYSQNIDARRMLYKFIKHNILFKNNDDDSDVQKIQMRASDMSVMTDDDQDTTRISRIDA